MTMSAKELGAMPAYPVTPPIESDGFPATGYGFPSGGLTKREAFAMAALKGMLSNSDESWTPQGYASEAVIYADALLEELAK